MNFIKNIFWNSVQSRLRAGWRIFFHLILLGMMTLLSQVVVVGVALIFNAPPAGADIDRLILFVNELIGKSPVFVVGVIALSGLSIIASVWLAGKWFDHRAFKGFGMQLDGRWWRDFIFGLMLGAVLMSLIFAVENAAGWVTITGTMVAGANATFAEAFLIQVVAFAFVGVYEELWSRGYQLTNLAEGMNQPKIGQKWAVIIAWLVSSLVFGFLHLGNPNATLVSTFNIFLAGLFLALPYVLTGNLGASIGIHFTWNLFQGMVFGFPVSGTTTSTTVIAIQQGGPELWTGGLFGPEAGLIGIAAILLGCGLTLLWVRWQYGKIEFNAGLGEYSKRGDA